MKIREKSKHENKLYKKKIKNILECRNVNDILHKVDEPDLNDSVMKYASDFDLTEEIPFLINAENKSLQPAEVISISNKNKNIKKDQVKHPKGKAPNGSNFNNVKNHKPKAVHSQRSSETDIGMIGVISHIVSSENQSNKSEDCSHSKLFSANNAKTVQSIHCDKNDSEYKINGIEFSNSNQSPSKVKSKSLENTKNGLKKKNKKMKKAKNKFKDVTINKNVISNLKKIARKHDYLENDNISKFQNIPLLKLETKNKNQGKISSKLSARIKVPQILLNTDYGFNSPEEHINYHHSVVELFDRVPVNEEVSFHTVDENISNIPEKELIEENLGNNHTDHETSMDVTVDDNDIHNSKSLLTFDNGLQALEKLPVNEEKDFKLYEMTNFCILTLKKGSKICFCGKIKVSLLFGCVEVLGHKLDEKFSELYSINGSSLLNFETLPAAGDLKDLKSKLIKFDVPIATVDDIFTDIVVGDAVLMIKSITNVLTQFVSKHLSNFDIFSNIKSTLTTNIQYSSMIQASFYSGNFSGVFTKNDSWNDVINSIIFRSNNNLRNSILFCGGKNAGKSTMMRYTINRILNHGPVLVIDLDPGQPEFTICGLVSVTIVEDSLLGPNFTHLKNPTRSYSIGLINVVENIDRYINAITNLAKFLYKSAEYVKMPWVINTMGFTDSMGLKLMNVILNLFKPTNVIEMKSATSKNNFSIDITSRNINEFQNDIDYQSWEHYRRNVSHNFEYFECVPYQSLWKTADKSFFSRNISTKTERLLNVLAYFSEMASLKCLSLLNVVPYIVSLDSIKVSMNSMIVENKYVVNILNGRLVNLCIENDASKRNDTNVYRLSATPVESLGYGLVRGVDVDSQTLYILTPVSGDLLNKVDLLVYAETLPDCCSLFSVPHLPQDTLIPYTAPDRDNADRKNLHQVPRRKFNAIRLLEIARKSSNV